MKNTIICRDIDLTVISTNRLCNGEIHRCIKIYYLPDGIKVGHQKVFKTWGIGKAKYVGDYVLTDYSEVLQEIQRIIPDWFWKNHKSEIIQEVEQFLK